MQTILVAGGAGFIGSNLCERLLDKNYRLICIDNLITGNKKNIEDFIKNKNFTFLSADLIDPSFRNIKLPKIDYIFHLASPASPNKKSPISYINFPTETLLVNSVGTYNLLKIARKFNSKFLYASSSEVYGDPKVSPQREDYFGNVNSVGIRSVYDEGKRFGEAITMAYFRKFNTDTRIIRIFNTYGSNMRADDGRVISNFINQAISNKPLTVYGNGSQTRSICYIDDLLDGLIRAIFSDRTKGEVLNLGNPNEKTILDLANIIKKMTNSSSEIIFEPLPEDDPKVRRPDINKAKNLIGWTPKVSIDQGLAKTIQYFKSL
ncbi:MAG: NAD-dependent dehydratase [Candidatus Levybacteria bacterium RIFCSPLOWO2_01_FULL_38_21]|nr:MAG: NAD-dependent dehydratase [Candidatus Levybacteria bacterium RIFCSPLOWO2_01_FULL_38_21]